LLAAAPGKVTSTARGRRRARGTLLDAGARVVGIDQTPPPSKPRASALGRDIASRTGNFRDAARARQVGVAEVDGALVDLGVSSPQLDDPGRGFSFARAGRWTCGWIRPAAAP